MTTDMHSSTEPSGIWLTTAEVANYLKISTDTVRQWRHRGTGPNGVRLGRHVRYRRTDVDAWIDEQAHSQQSPRF